LVVENSDVEEVRIFLLFENSDVENSDVENSDVENSDVDEFGSLRSS